MKNERMKHYISYTMKHKKIINLIKNIGSILLMIYLIDTIGFGRGFAAYLLIMSAFIIIPIIISKERRDMVIGLYMGTMRSVEQTIWGRTLDNLKKDEKLPKVKVVWKNDTKKNKK